MYGGAHRHTETIYAQEFEIVPTPAPSEPLPLKVVAAGQFTLRVPKEAVAARFDYEVSEGAGSMRVGEESSPDGRIVLLGSVRDENAVVYTYRFQ